MTAAVQKPFEIKGRHVLAAMVAFFGVIFAVNGVFMYCALGTFPGQTIDNPYEAGLAYNQALSAKAAQERLGWRAQVVAGQTGDVDVIFQDRDGAPVRGLALRARLERPATEAGRLEPRFFEVAPGLYRAQTGAMAGGWDLSVEASDQAGHAFSFEHRLVWR